MDEVRDLIRRGGPVPFSVFMEAALYGPLGFYTTGGGAGRRRDFLTSPEVGPLFGAVWGRALDTWWELAGQPDPFFVAECGAGPGTLCRDVLRSAPRCSGALRYVLVDAAEPMRALHQSLRLPLVEAFEIVGAVDVDSGGDATVRPDQGPLVCSLAELPTEPMHVVFCNELLDNLPFDVAQRDVSGWSEIRVGLETDGTFEPVAVELDTPRSAMLSELAPDAAVGATVPLEHMAIAWVGAARASVAATDGRVVAIDYAGSLGDLASRGGQWLRTYRGHERGMNPFLFPGACDITADIAVDMVALVHRPMSIMTQASFLRSHGVDEFVDEACGVWTERAAIGDLAAVLARSRMGEAEALLDPTGLGAFVVMEWGRH